MRPEKFKFTMPSRFIRTGTLRMQILVTRPLRPKHLLMVSAASDGISTQLVVEVKYISFFGILVM